jgi:BirA family biotin operon repressor/biotin-[acetyl-CoA-carboxylase] ligase
MIIDQNLLDSIDFIIDQSLIGRTIGYEEMTKSCALVDFTLIDALIESLEIPLSKTASGYMYMGEIDQLLSKDLILGHMAANPVFDIDIKRLVTSTNEVLMNKPGSSRSAYDVLVAEAQTGGRGRSQKQWFSPYGGNVYFSMRFDYKKIHDLSLLPLLVAVTLKDIFSAFGVVGVELKWPNDILVQGRKLAGILVESKSCGDNQIVVIGIGINVVKSDQILALVEQPVAFLEEFEISQVFDRNMLVARLIKNLINMLENPLDDQKLISTWSQADSFKGRPVEVMLSGQWKPGLAVGVGDKGQYVIEMETEKVEINSSYVSLRLAE